MTFAEFKKNHPAVNNVGYWHHSVTIPDNAESIPKPPGADVDGDVVDGKFVCFAYGEWWSWPTKSIH